MPPVRQIRPIWVKREHILDRRTWVYYLVINKWASRHLAEQIEVAPDDRFFKVLDKHVTAYVKENAAPPQEIASVVMNVADDYMAGRDVVLRAGDYIAMQNFVRG